MIHGLAVGALFLATGISMLVMIPHPIWFSVLALVLMPTAALLGGWLAGRGGRRSPAPAPV
jgi:hypothetical protein